MINEEEVCAQNLFTKRVRAKDKDINIWFEKNSYTSAAICRELLSLHDNNLLLDIMITFDNFESKSYDLTKYAY